MALSRRKLFGLAELRAVNEESVKSAGERYFLNKCPDFPDMLIEDFDEAIAGLIGGEGFRVCVEEIKDDIHGRWQDLIRRRDSYREMPPEPDATIRALEALAYATPGRGDTAIVEKCADAAYKPTKAISDKLFRQWHNAKASSYQDEELWRLVSGYKNSMSRAMNFLPKRAFSPIGGKLPYMHANACSVYKTGALILHSDWGMGKTHSLCHLTKKQQERGAPALLVLAKDFNPGNSPGDEFARYTKLADNFGELLQGLNSLGRKAKERALLLVDGINERNGGAWKKGLEDFLQQTLDFPFVGVIVSFRAPFAPRLSDEVLPKLSFLQHSGFKEIPFEAQPQFMKYYGVSANSIPLMAEEFTRPLMLKMMCESFRNLSKKEKRKGFSEMASGQKGMTYILEHYIKNRAKAVAKKHCGLSSRAVWKLIKEIMAPYMANNLAERMPAGIILKAMHEIFSVSGCQARKILRDMQANGVVVVRRGVFHKGTNMPVAGSREKLRLRMLVEMPYQWLGDHIIARWLLDEPLKKSSVGALRRCFYRNRPLGKIFAIDEHGMEFRGLGYGAGAGITEALILEFPERIKRVSGICPKERELLFYLPRWRERTGAYHDPFFSGLYWRTNSSISRKTVNLAAGYFLWKAENIIKSDIPYFYGDAVETLLSAACRCGSPLSAEKWLHPEIKKMSMTSRDIVWGAAVRDARRSRGWTRNLFSWLRQMSEQEFRGIKPEEARNYIALVALFLGSTDRPLRDEATEILVIIGEKFPAALFAYTLDALDFNDIYYPERMLAACYGVAMSQWQDTRAKEFRSEFPAFARKVAENIFMLGGCLLTHHAVVRDYALGIVDIARKMDVKFSDKEITYMSRPYPAVPSLFPAPADIDDATFSDASRAFTPDFHGRYTVPYISPEGQLADISRQIKWRVMNLGYTNQKFSATDRAIAELWREDYGKTDRCGKKYSWIAYHEMCGLLDAKGKLPREIRRVNDVLDPSFPTPPHAWNPKFCALDMKGDSVFWLTKGPVPDYKHLLISPSGLTGNWIMLDGYIIHYNENKDREVFSFLRGLLIAETDIPLLKERLHSSLYPGNFAIPECVGNHAVFDGEIPWAKNFICPDPDWEPQMAFDDVPVQTTVMHSRDSVARNEKFKFSEVWYPVPDICTNLGLTRRGRGVDLFDKAGKAASLYRADTKQSSTDASGKQQWNDFHCTYLRKDLLDKYLRIIGKRLVWIVWGERCIPGLPGSMHETLASRDLLHKKLVVYNPAK